MKNQLNWIEASRTLAMAIVVLAHINDLSYFRFGCKEWWSVGISALVCGTVPMFFMISGFLLNRNQNYTGDPLPISHFFRRKFHTMILPFFVWNIIYMILFKVVFNWPVFSSNTLWNMTTGYMHLYYIFVLIQFMFVFYLIQPYLIKQGLRIHLIGATTLTLIFYAGSELLLWNTVPDNHFFEWHYGKAFIGWSVFFFWGIWMGHFPRTIETLSRRILLLGATVLVSFAAFYWETNLEVTLFGYNTRQYFLISGLLYQFLSANFILALFYRLEQRDKNSFFLSLLAKSGKDTFGIYLSHIAIILCLLKFWGILNLTPTPIIKIPLILVMTWFLCRMLVRGMRLPSYIYINKILFGGRG